MLGDNKSQAEIEAKLGISQSQMSRIAKNQQEILIKWQTNNTLTETDGQTIVKVKRVTPFLKHSVVHPKASLTGSATYLLTESRGLTY